MMTLCGSDLVFGIEESNPSTCLPEFKCTDSFSSSSNELWTAKNKKERNIDADEKDDADDKIVSF